MSTVKSMTRTDILKFPFPYKLWIVINLELDFLQWNRDGTVILLDLVALEEYLNSTTSIFTVKNRSEFLTQLHEFKFERLNATPEADEDVLLQYKNENFQRHRLDLLAKIRRNTYELMDAMSTSIANQQKNQMKSKSIGIVGARIRNSTKLTKVATKLAMERMKGDLCFLSHGGLSDVQISRFRFQTILYFQHESRVLKEKIRMLDEKSANQQHLNHGANDMANDNATDQLIEFPADLYENPHDSAMTCNECTRHEYAGYYGKRDKEHLQNFFGEYLPMYEEGTMEIKHISADLITARNTETSRNLEGKNEENLTTTKPSETFVNSTPNKNLNISDSNLHFSSSLEPIYSNEEENDNSNIDSNAKILTPNKQTSKAEIPNEPSTNVYYSSTNGDENDNLFAAKPATSATQESGYPQMPTAIKIEVADPSENKDCNDHFRNFFSQYRASLNLLYEGY